MKELYKYYKDNKLKMKNSNQTEELYIKFGNVGVTHKSYYLENGLNNEIDNYKKIEELSGRSYGVDLKNRLLKILEIANSTKDVNSDDVIKNYIESEVKKDISVGVYIKDSIKLKSLMECDESINNFKENMEPKDDKVAKYIYEYLINNMIFEMN